MIDLDDDDQAAFVEQREGKPVETVIRPTEPPREA